MDWETSPVLFLTSVVVTAAVGGCAAGLKEINGQKFRWLRFFCRWIHRCVTITAAGLIISTFTTDLRMLWASELILAVVGVGEDTLIRWLPFNVDGSHHDTPKTRPADSRSDDS